jgi:hypothetical protein
VQLRVTPLPVAGTAVDSGGFAGRIPLHRRAVREVEMMLRPEVSEPVVQPETSDVEVGPIPGILPGGGWRYKGRRAHCRFAAGEPDE